MTRRASGSRIASQGDAGRAPMAGHARRRGRRPGAGVRLSDRPGVLSRAHPDARLAPSLGCGASRWEHWGTDGWRSDHDA